MLIKVLGSQNKFFSLRFAFTTIKSPIEKRIKLEKRKNRQLAQIKKQIAKKELFKSQDIYKEYHYKQIYQKIDISMESFFFKREYNIQNFNFLFNLIAEQQPPNLLPTVNNIFQKMNIVGISPNQKTYTYLIKIAALGGHTNLAEEYFRQACKQFLPNKYLYTSLIQSYVYNNNPDMALKIVNEMEEKGIQPDLPTYTTLINCLRLGRKLSKCWQINRNLVKKNQDFDETYVGVMIKVYAATHDAELSIKLYRENITSKGIKPALQTRNAYLKALSSRRQYADEVIDSFFSMAEKGQIINTETANWALRACSKTGNIRSSVQIIKIMKLKKLKLNKLSYNSLLRVYAQACKTSGLDEEVRQVLIADSWKLLNEAQQKGFLDTSILNSMLSLYTNSFKVEDIDGLVLPLFEKYNLELNPYTFETLLNMYYQMGEFNQFMRVWHHLHKKIQENKNQIQQFHGLFHGKQHVDSEKLNQNLRPSFKSIHLYLQVGIKMLDMKMVLEALKMFKQLNKIPNNQTLKFLGTLPNLPEEIRVSLMDFQINFGVAKLSKKSQENVQDPQNL